jgi:hypothetical protein
VSRLPGDGGRVRIHDNVVAPVLIDLDAGPGDDVRWLGRWPVQGDGQFGLLCQDKGGVVEDAVALGQRDLTGLWVLPAADQLALDGLGQGFFGGLGKDDRLVACAANVIDVHVLALVQAMCVP